MDILPIGDNMEYKRFDSTIIVRLDPGEDIVESLMDLVIKEDIDLGYISGLGAVNEVEIGLFSTEEKKYYSSTYKKDFEISSLHGNITKMDDKPYLHLHIIVSDINQNSLGGHLNRAIVSATAEIIVELVDGQVDRKFDEDIGLNLLKFD